MDQILTSLATPHHGVFVTMVVLGVEEANGKSCYWNDDCCKHNKVEDGHPILPGRTGGPGPPQTIRLQKRVLAVSDLGITS